MKLKTNLGSLLAVTLLSGGLATSAHAVKITGDISFSGNGAFVSTTDPGSPNENNATGVVFTAGLQNTGSATLDYAPISTLNDIATFKDFNFGVSGTTGALSVVYLWEVVYNSVTYRFELESISANEVKNSQRQLVGSGIATIVNGPKDYEATQGTFEFSASSDSAAFTFSSATVTVPDGGTTVALFGMCLLGLGAGRRFIRA